MKKENLNLSDFKKNTKSVSDFLSKKTMSKIGGGKQGDLDVPPMYCDTCYVRH